MGVNIYEDELRLQEIKGAAKRPKNLQHMTQPKSSKGSCLS
jgi:hypothetical protein